MAKRDFPPTHPGELLLEEFLRPMRISEEQLAGDLNVRRDHLDEILQGQRSMTAEMALRLGQYFGMEAQFWLNLQARYDLETARDEMAGRLASEVRRRVA